MRKDDQCFKRKSWHDATPNVWRRIVRGVIRDAVILSALAVGGEAAVRMFVRGSSQHIFTPTLTGGHPKKTNSLGLRDREFSIARPEGQIRVLCLGNSTTYGAGVAMEDTYPKQLENLLRKQYPNRDYLVINAGGEGRSVLHALEFLEQEGLAMQPSIVVLGFSPSMLGVIIQEQSDLETSQPSRTTRQATSAVVRLARAMRRAALAAHLVLLRSHLYTLYDANLRRSLYGCGILRGSVTGLGGAIFSYAFDVRGVFIEEVQVAYDLFSATLRRLQEFLKERHIPLVVLGLPSRFVLSDDPVDNLRRLPVDRIRIQPIDRVAKYCEDRDVPFVDGKKRFGEERQRMLAGELAWDDLYTALDYTHLNSRGHEMVAEELLAEFEARGWLNLSTAVP